MPAKGKATVETYRLGLKLLEMRRAAKHGEWLAAVRATGISQPTAWRYMRFARAVKRGDPGWKWIRSQDRLLRRIEADEKGYEREHGHKYDMAKALDRATKSLERSAKRKKKGGRT